MRGRSAALARLMGKSDNNDNGEDFGLEDVTGEMDASGEEGEELYENVRTPEATMSNPIFVSDLGAYVKKMKNTPNGFLEEYEVFYIID